MTDPERDQEAAQIWDRIKGLVQEVKVKMTVNSITCARTVRGKSGDEYVAMSVGMDSVKNEDETEAARPVSGMPMREAPFAALLLAMSVDIAAHEHAMSSGVISVEHGQRAIKMIRANYAHGMERIVSRMEEAQERKKA